MSTAASHMMFQRHYRFLAEQWFDRAPCHQIVTFGLCLHQKIRQYSCCSTCITYLHGTGRAQFHKHLLQWMNPIISVECHAYFASIRLMMVWRCHTHTHTHPSIQRTRQSQGINRQQDDHGLGNTTHVHTSTYSTLLAHMQAVATHMHAHAHTHISWCCEVTNRWPSQILGPLTNQVCDQ